MTGFTLRSRFDHGEKIFAGWLSSSSPRIAETVARAGFDACLFDLQHGDAGLEDVRDGIAAVRLAGKPSGVRVALDAQADGARCLDFGAEVMIMPMVDTPVDAARLVTTTKYSPLGGRSWGPVRAAELLGMPLEAYRQVANQHCIILAMVETRLAMDNLDAILATPGLDGVFVGPSDLSISLSQGAEWNPTAPGVIDLMKRVVARAEAVGKLTAAFCGSAAVAKANAEMGYHLMAVGSDWGFLADGARAALLEARGGSVAASQRY